MWILCDNNCRDDDDKFPFLYRIFFGGLCLPTLTFDKIHFGRLSPCHHISTIKAKFILISNMACTRIEQCLRIVHQLCKKTITHWIIWTKKMCKTIKKSRKRDAWKYGIYNFLHQIPTFSTDKFNLLFLWSKLHSFVTMAHSAFCTVSAHSISKCANIV